MPRRDVTRRSTLVAALGLASALACSSNRPWCLERSSLERHRARAIIRADGDGWGQTEYFVFDFADVPDEGLKHLSYKGTYRAHHLFKIYTKCGSSEYAYDIAIPVEQCEVALPRDVETETRAVHGSYRGPWRVDGKCRVNAAPETGSAASP